MASHTALYETPDYLEWSPKGDRLAFILPVADAGFGAATTYKNVNRIFTMDRYGGDLRLIGSPDLCPGVSECWKEYDPTWSPDGSQIAFYVENSVVGADVHGIWVMDSNGSNGKRIWTDENHCCQVSAGLSWSPMKIP